MESCAPILSRIRNQPSTTKRDVQEPVLGDEPPWPAVRLIHQEVRNHLLVARDDVQDLRQARRVLQGIEGSAGEVEELRC